MLGSIIRPVAVCRFYAKLCRILLYDQIALASAYGVVALCYAAPCDRVGVLTVADRCLASGDLNCDGLSSCKSNCYVLACFKCSLSLAECRLTTCGKCCSVVLLLAAVCYDRQRRRAYGQRSNGVFSLGVVIFVCYAPGERVVYFAFRYVCDLRSGCRCDRYYVAGAELVLILAGLFVQSSLSALVSVSYGVLGLGVGCSVIRPLTICRLYAEFLGALGYLLITVCNAKCNCLEVRVRICELVCSKTHVGSTNISPCSFCSSGEGEVHVFAGYDIERIISSSSITAYTVLVAVVFVRCMVTNNGDLNVNRSDLLVTISHIERNIKVVIIVGKLAHSKTHISLTCISSGCFCSTTEGEVLIIAFYDIECTVSRSSVTAYAMLFTIIICAVVSTNDGNSNFKFVDR